MATEVLRKVDLSGDGGAVKEVLVEGDSSRPFPPEGSEGTLHYTGYLTDGTVFDSSVQRNVPFKTKIGVGMVIKGWDLCMATMYVGEKCRLTCTSEYAYGDNGSPPVIPPKATLVFDMELLDYKKPIDSIPDKIEAANQKKDEGNDLFKQQKFKEAYDVYEEALNFFQYTYPKGEEEKLMNSTKLPILLNQAACQLRLKEYKKARISCEKCLDIDETNVKAIFRRGQAWQGMGDFEKAKIDFIAAIKLDPHNQDLRKAYEALKRQEQQHLEQQKKMFKNMFQ
eukprot:TRINITY_DN1539_c0_g1_i1.p1 TRINITY_DN1539_c0_g1~~TRINITY_DN1539_c0_g1_i1.p1  ORF type:complete len:316 (-),score=84.78 TRINITY_DN1539_c0_g1_i1:110-955(-)